MKKIFLIQLIAILSIGAIAQTELNQETFLSNSRQLIYEGKRSGEGYFSEDGRYMIFQSEREEDNPFYQIYILDLETGDINRVSPGYGKTTCSYFQWGEGNRVMFASSHLDPKAKEKQKEELDFRASGQQRRYSWDYEDQMDIFSANRDGSDIIRLTDELGYDAEGAYSPDGKLIVFSSNRNAYNRKLNKEEQAKFEVDKSYFGEVYIMNADGSNVKQLTNIPGYDGGTFFSPDGKKIIWRRFGQDGHSANVFTMNIDGSDEKQITDFGCLSWAPFYHPTMNYIIFAANKEGYANFELYIVDVEGKKEPVRVTYTDGFDGLPVFTPDGKKLVWTADHTSNKAGQLFIADWNHEAALKAIKEAPFRDQNLQGVDYNFSSDITINDLKTKLIYLASDELKGRMTGSEGAKAAAKYSAGIFKKIGLKPFVGQKDFYISFDYIADFEIKEENNKFYWGRRSFNLNEEYVPFSTSENGSITSEVVFAGYGIKIEKNNYSYNSYENIDVKDKIVMVLTGIPEGLDDEKKEWFERSIASGHKQMLARDMGAKGMILVSDRSLNAPIVESAGSAGLMMVKITENIADELLKPNESSVKDLQKALSGGDPKSLEHFFSLKDDVKLDVEVNKVKSEDNNVIGMLLSNNKSAKYIFIGGHYDHLGLGEINSRADSDHLHDIHNGADDNASGTTTVIELAEYFAGIYEKDKNLIKDNLVFCLWSGEEIGLLGSSDFAKDLNIPEDQIKAYLNFDMVGRLKDNKLELQGLGSAEEWKQIIERKNIISGFNLLLSEDPYLPTDATSFYLQKIPVIAFFTGIHMDYHTERDDAEFINFEGMKRISNFASLIIKELMKPEQTLTYKSVKMKAKKGSRGNASITLGTIPQYAGNEGKGMQIQGVREGAPAEKAGIIGGDVVISMAGKDVNDIYDFMNIMGEMKAGVEYEITVIRDGEKLKLTIIPETK